MNGVWLDGQTETISTLPTHVYVVLIDRGAEMWDVAGVAWSEAAADKIRADYQRLAPEYRYHIQKVEVAE